MTGKDYVGGVVGKATNSTITNCYYKTDGSLTGVYDNTDAAGKVESMSATDMQTEAFKTTLNSNAETYNTTNPTAIAACGWGWESGKYPYLTFKVIEDYPPTKTDSKRPRAHCSGSLCVCVYMRVNHTRHPGLLSRIPRIA